MMNIKVISENLLKYKNITPPDDYVRVYISEYLKTTWNIQIPKKNIKINKKIAFVKTNSVVKNELFLKKNLLLNALERVFGKKIISDIK